MKNFMIIFTILSSSVLLNAQDLLSSIDTGVTPKDYTIATFKGTRLVNFHTVETLSKGTLEIRISHRFGAFSTGSNNFWGLDGPATIQIRADYAPTNRLLLGIGRSSDQKMADGFVKYKILRQSTDGAMPVSLTGMASLNISTTANAFVQDRYQYFSSRFSYLASVMVARKFNSNFSLQISPTYTHFNLVDNLTDKNDLLSVIVSTRYKLNKRIALTLEYMKRLTRYTANASQYNDVLGIGFDIETGGHVFQVFVTNGSAINETRAINYTSYSINNGMMLGFNLSRVFSIQNKKLTK